MRKLTQKKGQSTLEYVIVLTAIVAAILFAVTQFIKPQINELYEDASASINKSGELFRNVFTGVPGAGGAGGVGGGGGGGGFV